MKRDWELIRQILMALEEKPPGEHVPSIDGIGQEEFAYHVQLLHDAGLITGFVSTYLDGKHSGVAIDLTWSGHEFLDKIRSQGVWANVKEQAKHKGIALSFDVIKELAAMVVKAMLS